MYDFVVIIILFLLTAVYLSRTFSSVFDDRVFVEAFDGRKYRVRNTKHKKETAEALARLTGKINGFLEMLITNGDPKFRIMTSRLKGRFNPETISEGAVDKRYTSYTVNKGEEVVLCMRSRDDVDSLYDDNVIFYVALHELAHIASIGENHNEEFHENFRYLLKKAAEFNMFQKVSKKFHYCGLDVNGM